MLCPFCVNSIGVVEYLSNGGVADNHKDFKELRYNECLMNFSCNGKNGSSEGRITHGFQLKSAYENNLMPYTNYTFDFKVSGSLQADGESTYKHVGSKKSVLCVPEREINCVITKILCPCIHASIFPVDGTV